MSNRIFSTIILLITLSASMFATNELTVKDNSSHGSKPGFIEKATLVIEPFGGYVAQSLYLEYSERKQFTSNLLEIVHRFELPKDAVINDMWLWIGDSVMQAKMYDTWSARGIYDSIVAAKYDPAFLAKNGNQYELKIYPLAAGSYRKIKINFIVPTKWYGNQAMAEIPIKMLKSNNSNIKPLEILFRTQRDIWGVPSISESPQSKFVNLVDTLDYNYQYLVLNDISTYTSLNLKFNTEFTNGYYINGYQDKSDSTYFQLGILPKDFFNVKADASPRNVLVALDLSGSYRKNLAAKLPDYMSLVLGSLKSNDNFKLLVSGNEKIVDYTNSFVTATQQNINTAFNEFGQSDFAKAIDQFYTPNILFCDYQAGTNWNFTGLSSMTHVKIIGNIRSSVNSITESDIVAAYDHGYEDPLDQATADKVIMRLDSLFTNGGRFLTYYDYNRERSGEKLASHYITGLKVKANTHDAVTLYRNINGNIGKDFPESFTRNASYFLDYNDPDVKVELRDQAGNAAVISKRIKNGLIVVTGIWSLRDDGAMKTLLGAPLLGVNSSKKPFTLDDLLVRIKQEYNANNFSKAIILSDSDSLITKVDAGVMAQTYLAGYPGSHPKFMTVNLLDNDIITPASIIDGLNEYYGSGYFLYKLADGSKGIHMEKHLYDWPYISNVFSPYAIPSLIDLKISTVVDGGNDSTIEMREVNTFADPNKPKFFLGKSVVQNLIEFNIAGRFEGAGKDSLKQFSFLVPHDTTSYNKIVRSMLGNEKINDQFKVTPVDTSEVVRLSISYNLLTDFSALLALEPNEEFHFLKDPPLDEGGLTEVMEDKKENDSTVVSVYPNPFNSMTTIKIHLNTIASISANVYNILGQRVIEIANSEFASGDQRFTWNGKNDFGITVGSGFYILRVIVTDQKTKKENVYTHKLMHLK